MLLDILIGVPMILFVVLGARDGVVRKLVASAALIVGLFLGQIYMQDVGKFLAGRGGVNNPDTPMYGFLVIFLGLFLLQSLLYKLITSSYKIGGIADRVSGTIVGFIEGALFISSMLYILALSGFPERETKRDTRFYKPFVNIAPQILDLASLVRSDTFDKFKEIGSGTQETMKDKKGKQ